MAAQTITSDIIPKNDALKIAYGHIEKIEAVLDYQQFLPVTARERLLHFHGMYRATRADQRTRETVKSLTREMKEMLKEISVALCQAVKSHRRAA